MWFTNWRIANRRMTRVSKNVKSIFSGMTFSLILQALLAYVYAMIYVFWKLF